MEVILNTNHDTDCIISHADGLDASEEDIKNAYTAIHDRVQQDVSITDPGVVDPAAIHERTIKAIAHTFPTIDVETIQRLGATVSIPASVSFEPVFVQVFSEALSTVGRWNIQNQHQEQSHPEVSDVSFSSPTLDN